MANENRRPHPGENRAQWKSRNSVGTSDIDAIEQAAHAPKQPDGYNDGYEPARDARQAASMPCATQPRERGLDFARNHGPRSGFRCDSRYPSLRRASAAPEPDENGLGTHFASDVLPARSRFGVFTVERLTMIQP
jgi:hypothetical protein